MRLRGARRVRGLTSEAGVAGDDVRVAPLVAERRSANVKAHAARQRIAALIRNVQETLGLDHLAPCARA
jgi:hypothetical protein